MSYNKNIKRKKKKWLRKPSESHCALHLRWAMRFLRDDNLFTREVWEGNLDEELAMIRGIIDQFPYVAMDTEFPGVVRAQIAITEHWTRTDTWTFLFLRRWLARWVTISYNRSSSTRPFGTRSRARLLCSHQMDQADKIELPAIIVTLTLTFSLRCNVDMLKLIQLGLTLTDKDGNLPMIGNHYCIWQFNFREFDLKEDMFRNMIL